MGLTCLHTYFLCSVSFGNTSWNILLTRTKAKVKVKLK